MFIIQIINIFALPQFFQNDIFSPKYIESFLSIPLFSIYYPIFSRFFLYNSHHIYATTIQ